MSARPPGSVSGRWALSRPPSGFASRDFPDGRALYDLESGSTQLISPLAQFLIDMLAGHAQGCEAAELLGALLTEEAQATPQEGQDALGAALDELAVAGLVRRLPPLS